MAETELRVPFAGEIVQVNQTIGEQVIQMVDGKVSQILIDRQKIAPLAKMHEVSAA